MSIYYDNYYDANMRYSNQRKARKITNDPTKHYPNKDEATELRKIMSETGLTEEEIRADKKYRKQLSATQKAGQKAKRTETERTFQRLIKVACKRTGFTPQHPDTIKALQKILDAQVRGYFRVSFIEKNNLIAENVIKQYAKK